MSSHLCRQPLQVTDLLLSPRCRKCYRFIYNYLLLLNSPLNYLNCAINNPAVSRRVVKQNNFIKRLKIRFELEVNFNMLLSVYLKFVK